MYHRPVYYSYTWAILKQGVSISSPAVGPVYYSYTWAILKQGVSISSPALGSCYMYLHTR